MQASTSHDKLLRAADWSARLIAAVILLQTLYFKFTGSPESVYIFTTVGQEPWGRWGSGFVELAASLLLLSPRGVALGAALAAGTMCGAIFFHLTKLGIEVQGDGGLLFALAVTVLACASSLLALHWRKLPFISLVTDR